MDDNEMMNNSGSEYPEINPQEETARRPVYDPFMYEPIGFDTFDKEKTEELNRIQAAEEKKRRRRQETTILATFFLIFIVAAGLSGYAVYTDMKRGIESAEGLKVPNSIVIYQNSKPEGANDPENFVDENGKYTPEGVAAAVKSSIVEIYTYTDSMKMNLSGTGSGVVLSDGGYIVTNAHVLSADGYHEVHTVDGDVFDAKIVGRDAKTDIAVIKVENNGLQPAVLGNSDEVIVGEKVIAIGNPAGLSSSVTDGIVSAVGRKIKSDSTGFEMSCIQTDAAISPGNSGGALVNMYGQVIGITSSKYVSSSYEGLGFAITINEVKPIIEELVENGYMSGRFRIGITLIDMETSIKVKNIEEALGFELPEGFEGIYISSISDDSDVKNTELKVGDFITAINGKDVSTYDEFYDAISSRYKAGDKVPATCAHIDKNKKVTYYNIEFKLLEDTSGNY